MRPKPPNQIPRLLRGGITPRSQRAANQTARLWHCQPCPAWAFCRFAWFAPRFAPPLFYTGEKFCAWYPCGFLALTPPRQFMPPPYRLARPMACPPRFGDLVCACAWRRVKEANRPIRARARGPSRSGKGGNAALRVDKKGDREKRASHKALILNKIQKKNGAARED